MKLVVSVVIVNYNTPELVYDCLLSIAAHLHIAHEIIVVDNGSPRPVNPKKLLHYSNLRYIRLEQNKGFGAGNNIAAAFGQGEFIWFLNTDTVLPDNSIELAIAYMQQHPEVGGLTPLLFNDIQQKHIQSDFYAHFQSLTTVISRKPQSKIDVNQEWQPVDMVVAASFIMPRILFEQLKGFDENFFMFMEDDDLCYRIHRAGKQVGVHTKARIIHLQGRSIAQNSERKKLYYNSQSLFWRTHYGMLPTITMQTIRTIYLLMRRIFQLSK